MVTGEFTDYSHLHYQDVLKDVRASGAALHTVVLTNPEQSLTNEEARNRATVLDRGPRESGGVRTDVLTSMSFEPRLKILAVAAQEPVSCRLRAAHVAHPPRKNRGLVGETRARCARYAGTGAGQQAMTKPSNLRVLVLTLGRAAVVVAAVTTLASSSSVAARDGQQPQRPEVFKAAVDIVSLNVTVVDNQNHYITDVTEKEFSVFEDGTRQELTFFNRSSLPIALSLLVDTSASMENRLPIAQEAAIGFARKLRAQDFAQVVDFDSRVEITQAFTSSVADLEKAIRATTAGGSTSLHNALYISLKELAKIKAKSESEIRRRAIIVLSDGEDTSSLVSYEEVLDLAKRSETAIYTIGLQPRDATAEPRLPRGGVRPAAVRAGDRRPRLFPVEGRRPQGRLRADCRRALQPVHHRLRLEERSP